jgi:hypothetical protein
MYVCVCACVCERESTGAGVGGDGGMRMGHSLRDSVLGGMGALGGEEQLVKIQHNYYYKQDLNLLL